MLKFLFWLFLIPSCVWYSFSGIRITDDHTIVETNIPLQHRIVDSTTAAVAKLQELFPVDLPPLWPPIKLAFTKAFIPNLSWAESNFPLEYSLQCMCVFCLHEITCSSLCSWWHLRCSREKCTLSYVTKVYPVKVYQNAKLFMSYHVLWYVHMYVLWYFQSSMLFSKKISTCLLFLLISKPRIAPAIPIPPTCTPLIEFSKSPSRRPQPPRPPSRRPRGGANALGSDSSENVSRWVSNGSCVENWL